MTAFTKTQLPDAINTLEEVAIWAISALSYVNADLKVVEGAGISERAAQAGSFYVDADQKYRFLGRVSIQMSADLLAGNQKPWLQAIELSTTVLPTIFSS